MTVPGRLSHVTILLLHGDVELPWESREQLLAHIRSDDDSARIVKAFEGAGASAPVRLKRPDKQWLAERITRWAEVADVGGLPPGTWDLRNALLDDVEHNTSS